MVVPTTPATQGPVQTSRRHGFNGLMQSNSVQDNAVNLSLVQYKLIALFAH